MRCSSALDSLAAIGDAWGMTIKTKTELLNAMAAYGACDPAVEYVTAQPDDATAAEIWLGCANPDWLVWFGARHQPAASIEAFAFACADRAMRVYAADALARAGFVSEAAVLRALAPIIDSATAYAGEVAARAAARSARSARSARATYSNAAASADAASAAAYTAAYDRACAGRSAAEAAYAAYAARAAGHAVVYERRIQLVELHASVDAILG